MLLCTESSDWPHLGEVRQTFIGNILLPVHWVVSVGDKPYQSGKCRKTFSRNFYLMGT